MLPVNCGNHADYPNFVVTNIPKYYPDSNAFSRGTWDIIECFWNLDFSYTNELLASKYSKFGPLQELHPTCNVPTFCPSILKFILLPIRLLSLRLILFMLSSADLILEHFQYWYFLRKLWDSDSDNFSPISILSKRKKQNSLSRKVLKPNLLRNLLLTNYSNHWKRTLFPLMTSLAHPFLRFTAMNF